jgi:hypothetical protein
MGKRGTSGYFSCNGNGWISHPAIRLGYCLDMYQIGTSSAGAVLVLYPLVKQAAYIEGDP